jgi:hypothetical protein
MLSRFAVRIAAVKRSASGDRHPRNHFIENETQRLDVSRQPHLSSAYGLRRRV